MDKHKYCSHCKTTEAMSYIVNSKSPDKTKVYYHCNDCNTARLKKYRTTEAGKAAALRAVKKYESSNMTRKRAWDKAKAVPLEPCVMCGKLPAHRHHPDLSRQTYVVFLCPYHHKQAHSANANMQIEGSLV